MKRKTYAIEGFIIEFLRVEVGFYYADGADAGRIFAFEILIVTFEIQLFVLLNRRTETVQGIQEFHTTRCAVLRNLVFVFE